MKTIDEMSTHEFVQWAKGYILIGIGEGRFDSAVTSVIMSAMQIGGENAVKAQKEKKVKK